mgnify:CR=1 FL=1
MDWVLCGASAASVFIVFLHFFKHRGRSFTYERIVLLFCTISLIIKASGHVWLPDGAGRDHGGFDYALGNANVITTILLLYGEMQYVWVFWNLMFLFFDPAWIKTAVRVHFAAAVFMLTFVKFLWPHIKEYPVIGPPVGGALRPGQYLWLMEFALPAIAVLMDVFKFFVVPKKNKVE